jgi:hypothetical protein
MLTLILVGNLSITKGQTVSSKNLTWFSEQNIEKHSGLNMNAEVKIVVNESTSVDIIEQGQLINFKVQGVSGNWQNENKDGMLTYSILYNNTEPGTMTIQRTNGTAKITIDFTAAKADGMYQEYFISRVEPN